jgi:toxin ParE1/3/4
MSRLFWSAGAREDLLEIGRYIRRDDPAAARRWVKRLRERARGVVAVPLAGRKVPEFAREDIREVLLGAYRIVYRVLEGEIHVLAVREGHRLLGPDALPDTL